MRSARTAAAVAAAAFLLCACTAVETTAVRDDLGGHVDFQVGGGIAGNRQSLSIGNDGQAVARDDERGTEGRQRLDAARLGQLRTAFAKVEARDERPSPSLSRPCADCVYYSVKATIDGVRHRATLTAGGQDSSPYREVIALLSTILQETLSRSGKNGS